MDRKTLKRFWMKVDKRSSPHGCWLWKAGINSKGYGIFHLKRVTLYAHRVSWQLVNGPIPPKLQIDHFRRNKAATRHTCSRNCVNPEHMRVVTNAENARASDFMGRPKTII